MKKCFIWFVLPIAICIAGAARGDYVVATQDWNEAGLNGWTSDEGWVNLSNPGAGGNTGGYLQVELEAVGMFEGKDYALPYTGSTNFYTGAWNTNYWVAFDFWASNTQPGYVQVQWAGTNDTNRVWASTVFDSNDESMSLETWTGLTSPKFLYHTDWDYLDALDNWTQQDFIDDLASIDWIGVYIWRTGTGQQFYGIDNFKLMVPEPGQMLMLLAAVLGSAGALRGKKPAIG
ncbi:MAG: hypothetical protein R6V03_04425 [Kiritimatiellia bacterium]